MQTGNSYWQSFNAFSYCVLSWFLPLYCCPHLFIRVSSCLQFPWLLLSMRWSKICVNAHFHWILFLICVYTIRNVQKCIATVFRVTTFSLWQNSLTFAVFFSFFSHLFKFLLRFFSNTPFKANHTLYNFYSRTQPLVQKKKPSACRGCCIIPAPRWRLNTHSGPAPDMEWLTQYPKKG